MKARIDGFIRFVSVYVIIVFICLFNCVDLNMQPKIDMVFSAHSRLEEFSFIFVRNAASAAMRIEKQRRNFESVWLLKITKNLVVMSFRIFIKILL